MTDTEMLRDALTEGHALSTAYRAWKDTGTVVTFLTSMNHLTKFVACRVDLIRHSSCAGPSMAGAVGMITHATFQLAFQL
jgi:hypothetical protein